MRNEDACDEMGTDSGSAVSEGTESGAAEDAHADADDERPDADQTESPSHAAQEDEKKEDEQDSKSSPTSAQTTQKSSRCEDFILFVLLCCCLLALSLCTRHPSFVSVPFRFLCRVRV